MKALHIAVPAALGVAALLVGVPDAAQAAPDCSAEYLIDETLPSGARWRMCWEHRLREGIVLWDVSYTPAGGTEVMVLRSGNIAQIHVPYDDNGARYHDVSDYGLGGSRMNDLTPADCPSGTLVQFGSKDVICKRILPRDEAHATSQPGGRVLGDALSLFSVTHVGAYNYIPDWRFYDDGSIVPWIGATGQLQRRRTGSQNAVYGWQIRSGATYGVSHLHNYYWRLDFDIGGTANNDVVEQLEASDADGGLRRVQSRETLTSEAARSIAPERRRSWRIADGALANAAGNAISWHLEPRDTGHRDTGPNDEPWTFNDVYFTVNNDCELYASHNPQANGCGENVSEFVNGQTLTGNDLVVWYGLTFHHIPRDEDEARMPAHWNSFEIRARDVHDETPLIGDLNEAPTLQTPAAQAVTEGESFSLALIGADPDGDTLTYSASGLPTGIALATDTGIISGTPVAGSAGSYTVAATVSDGELSANASFGLVVEAANTAPDLIAPAAQAAVEGEAFSLALEASDPDGDALSFIASGLPGGVSVTPGTNLIAGTPTTGSAGTYSVTATASDGSLVDSETFELTVEAPLPPPTNVLLEADFNSGDDGFAFRSDTFRDTTAPLYSSGQYLAEGGHTGGGLEVRLGNVDWQDIPGMSGAWETSFTLDQPAKVRVRLRYKLVMSPYYEYDERSYVMAAIDGTLVEHQGSDYIDVLRGNGNGGPDDTTGCRQIELSTPVLAAGSHTLALGGYNDLKTAGNEVTLATIDDVVVSAEVVASSTLVSASFDSGTDGFTYADDRFRGTAQPDYAEGQYVAGGGYTGGGLEVSVGNHDWQSVEHMSGAWELGFSLAAPGAVTVNFRYRLTMSTYYEYNERSYMMAAIDGVAIDYQGNDYIDALRGNGNDGPDDSTGWQHVALTTPVLTAGDHTLSLGAYNDLKTAGNEVTTATIDDVVISGGSGALVSATFDGGLDGFVYADDRFRATGEPAYAQGQYLAAGGRSGGGLQVTVGGVDDADILEMSGGFAVPFTLDAPGAVFITFDYRLTQTPFYEWKEISEVLAAVNGVLVSAGDDEWVERLRKGKPSAGWKTTTIITGVLDAGTHLLELGAWNNKKTRDNESTTVDIDNVVVDTF